MTIGPRVPADTEACSPDGIVTPERSAESETPDVTAADQQTLSGERLVERCQAGCPEAFGILVQRYEERIFNFLFQMTRNRHDAEDLTQDTFLKAYKAIQRFNTSQGFSTWLFTIAKRTAYNHFRDNKPSQELPSDEQADCKDPLTLLQEKDEQTSIWKLAEALNPDQYEALWLRYGEGFSMSEIATILRTNQIRVRVLLHRARKILAKSLRAGGTHPNFNSEAL